MGTPAFIKPLVFDDESPDQLSSELEKPVAPLPLIPYKRANIEGIRLIESHPADCEDVATSTSSRRRRRPDDEMCVLLLGNKKKLK